MMWKALRDRHFAHLFFASLVSEIGTKIHRIALLVLVYSATQNALLVSLTLGVQLFASVVMGPMLAPWADVQERRRLLIGTDLLRMVLVPLIPLAGVDAL